jgi:putative peptidoglycan lipid II flippase
MSSVAGGADEVAAALRVRLERGLRRIAFFVLPSGVAFIALGDIVAGALFQTGRFTHADTLYVWGILAGSAVGLLASTLGRLYASAYYALRDTRTPLRFAIIRVTLTVGLGLLFAFPLPKLLGLGPEWGAAGLTASAGIAGWVEFALLRRGLNARIGRTGLPMRFTLQLELAAIIGAALAWGIKIASHEHQPIALAVITLIPYGAAYLAVAFAMGIGEARDLAARLRRRA